MPKPWVCEAHFYLHPPSFSYNTHRHWYFHRRFKKSGVDLLEIPVNMAKLWYTPSDYDVTSFQKATLSTTLTTLRYEVMVTTSIYNKDNHAWVAGVIYNRSKFHSKTSTTGWELLVISTNISETKGRVSKFFGTAFKITKLYHLCHNCLKCHPYNPVKLIDLVTVGQRRVGQRWEWTKLPISKAKLEEMINYSNSRLNGIILKLGGFSPHKLYGVFNPNENMFGEQEDPDWRIQQKVIATGLENITYQVYSSPTEKSFCSKFEDHPDLKVCGCYPSESYFTFLHSTLTGRYDPLHFPFRESNLKFVSCGYYKGNLPYYDLISPYDIASWIVLATTSIVLPLIYISIERVAERMRMMRLKGEVGYPPGSSQTFVEKYIQYVFGSQRVLVDQGPPCDDLQYNIVVKFLAIRFVLTAHLLVAVVLSNAYKGDNITRLASPLPPIPYSNIRQLVEHKYEIFSTPLYSTSWQWHQKFAVSNKSSPQPHHLLPSLLELSKNSSARVDVTLESELHYFLRMSQPHTQHKNLTSLNFTKQELFYLKNTRMSKLDKNYFKVRKILGRKEFYNLLKCANPKEAVVAEEVSLSRLQFMYLRYFKSEFASELSFGTEVLARVTSGFQFMNHWVNLKLLRRMQVLQEAGFIQYIRNFRESFYSMFSKTSFPTQNDFKSPNMGGSIKVIFLLLLAGLCLSFLLFIIEVCKKSYGKRHGPLYCKRINLMSDLKGPVGLILRVGIGWGRIGQMREERASE
ncbi:unnamed protein product [Orchesella dallaii]|uniref:Uncharacterized protein n=1 Tax=Orchesella dallaii TaxID=48710 RepID=A0ABP1R9W0_9HEXA